MKRSERQERGLSRWSPQQKGVHAGDRWSVLGQLPVLPAVAFHLLILSPRKRMEICRSVKVVAGAALRIICAQLSLSRRYAYPPCVARSGCLIWTRLIPND